jgi:hypothetical protein
MCCSFLSVEQRAGGQIMEQQQDIIFLFSFNSYLFLSLTGISSPILEWEKEPWNMEGKVKMVR